MASPEQPPCPGCGKPVPEEVFPVLFRYRGQLWCSVPCMEVAGELRPPYVLGSPDKLGVREVRQEEYVAPCCPGGPQWGHAWNCPQCPD